MSIAEILISLYTCLIYCDELTQRNLHGNMEQPGTSGNFSDYGASASTSSLASGPSSDFPRFKDQTEKQIFTLQRLVQEIKNTYRLEKEQSHSIMNDMGVSKGQAKMIEQRLSQLQRVVASQTDGTSNLKKDVEGKDSANKEQITAITTEIAGIKTVMDTLARQVENVQRNSGAVGGALAANLPENLSQMFAALERQLGMYDVSIAEMDLRFQILETTSYDGKLIWRIRDYARRKEDAKKGRALSIYSQPFYTSKYGYKMCARVYLNGDGMGRGTHISVFFVVMKGDYDALLPWPFRQKVTMTMLDQGSERRHLSDHFRPDPTSSSFKRPSSDMNIASGCPLFASHANAEGSSYVKDDTIYIRIVVDTTDLENF